MLLERTLILGMDRFLRYCPNDFFPLCEVGFRVCALTLRLWSRTFDTPPQTKDLGETTRPRHETTRPLSRFVSFELRRDHDLWPRPADCEHCTAPRRGATCRWGNDLSAEFPADCEHTCRWCNECIAATAVHALKPRHVAGFGAEPFFVMPFSSPGKVFFCSLCSFLFMRRDDDARACVRA